jgi:hypothetical protein
MVAEHLETLGFSPHDVRRTRMDRGIARRYIKEQAATA